jgi:unsaturated rhamnogalacturonyl hydrolase
MPNWTTCCRLKTVKPNDTRMPWWWCDALFMAPPVWVKMYKSPASANTSTTCTCNWKRTSDLLYDKEGAPVRARRQLHQQTRAERQEDVLVARRRLGDGRTGADPRRLIPADDPQRGFYVQQLREMSARIAELQERTACGTPACSIRRPTRCRRCRARRCSCMAWPTA